MVCIRSCDNYVTTTLCPTSSGWVTNRLSKWQRLLSVTRVYLAKKSPHYHLNIKAFYECHFLSIYCTCTVSIYSTCIHWMWSIQLPHLHNSVVVLHWSAHLLVYVLLTADPLLVCRSLHRTGGHHTPQQAALRELSYTGQNAIPNKGQRKLNETSIMQVVATPKYISYMYMYMYI